MNAFVEKCKRRKYRVPKPADLFPQLHRKAVDAINEGVLKILIWICESILPADPFRMLAELKITSPELKQTELTLLRPLRRFLKELKSTIRCKEQFSAERKALESVAAAAGNEFYCAIIDSSESSNSETSKSGSSSDSEKLDNPHSTATTKRSKVRLNLFPNTEIIKKRRRKTRQAMANKNRALLKTGERLDNKRFCFNVEILERAADFVLAHTKVRGVSKTRLALDKPYGSFIIPIYFDYGNHSGLRISVKE